MRGAGSPVIEIDGVGELHPVDHTVVGDRIEAGTFLAMGGLVGQPVTVRGFDCQHLGLVLKKYEQMGITIERGEHCCTASRDVPLRPTDIQTLPFPGFPTDMHGSGTDRLAEVLKGLGCVVTQIHGERSEDFGGIHPEPADPWADDCEQAVVSTGAELGVLLDGDGDRAALVDETGRILSPHELAPLMGDPGKLRRRGMGPRPVS